MLEKTFQAKVIKKFKTIPRAWVRKWNDATSIGLPDLIVGVPGKCFAIELKTKSKLSEIQFITLEQMEKSGGFETFVMTPQNFEEIFRYIHDVATNGPARLQRPARFPQWTLPTSQRNK